MLLFGRAAPFAEVKGVVLQVGIVWFVIWLDKV
jgi:hypothetical protein